MAISHPASRKIYISGSRPDLRVPMREVCLHGGEPPLRLYDTAGPWTDPDAHPDIKQGLAPLPIGASATTTPRWAAFGSPRSGGRCAHSRAGSSPRCATRARAW